MTRGPAAGLRESLVRVRSAGSGVGRSRPARPAEAAAPPKRRPKGLTEPLAPRPKASVWIASIIMVLYAFGFILSLSGLV